MAESFDKEVLRAVAVGQLLDSPHVCYRTVPWHQCIDIWAVEESEAQFLARYCFDRLQAQDRWDANLSAFMNHVVDAVLGRAGFVGDAAAIRRSCLLILCRQYIGQTPLDVRETKSHNLELSGPFFRPHLFPPADEPAITEVAFETHVLVAQLLLFDTVRRWKDMLLDGIRGPLGSSVSDILGSVVHATIKTGQLPLVRYLYGYHTDLSGSATADEDVCPLNSAVETRNLAIVRLVMYNGNFERSARLAATGQAFHSAIVTAIRLRAFHLAWYLLGCRELDESCDSSHYSDEPASHDDRFGDGFLLHEGLRESCHQGDEELVRFFLEHWDTAALQWASDCCLTPLEIAARAGHGHIVQLLLISGAYSDARADPVGKAKPDRISTYLTYWGMSWHAHRRVHALAYRRQPRSAGAMLAAAVVGRTDIAESLLERGIDLSAAEWERVVLGAVERSQTNFVRWMLDMGLFVPSDLGASSSGRHQADLMELACVWGSPDTVRLLAARGFPLHGVYCCERDKEDRRYSQLESPVLTALNWSRPDIHAALMELGACPVDPLRSPCRADWEDGHYPRKPRVRPLKMKRGTGVREPAFQR